MEFMLHIDTCAPNQAALVWSPGGPHAPVRRLF
jgi:hypothetical protein